MTTKDELAKQKVLAVHERASCWAGYGDNPTSFTIWGSGLKNHGECLGRGATIETAWQNAAESLPAQADPKFQKVYCSQCGGEFGPRDSGYSHCEDHQDPLTDRDNYLIEEGLRAYKEGDSMRCGKSETAGWTCRRKLAHSGPCAPEPVASVEAKEKCQHCGHVLSPLGNCSNCEEPFYEPKPTPSTPADEPCEWYGRNVGPHDWINTPDGWKRCANCKLEYRPIQVAEPQLTPATEPEDHLTEATNAMGKLVDVLEAEGYEDGSEVETLSSLVHMRLLVLSSPKPQPGSSSIPAKPRFYCFDRSAGVSTCGTQCNNCWAKGASMEPGSSSISTEPMPEQLVSEETLEAYIDSGSIMARDLRALREWAKGQSDGR